MAELHLPRMVYPTCCYKCLLQAFDLPRAAVKAIMESGLTVGDFPLIKDAELSDKKIKLTDEDKTKVKALAFVILWEANGRPIYMEHLEECKLKTNDKALDSRLPDKALIPGKVYLFFKPKGSTVKQDKMIKNIITNFNHDLNSKQQKVRPGESVHRRALVIKTTPEAAAYTKDKPAILDLLEFKRVEGTTGISYETLSTFCHHVAGSNDIGLFIVDSAVSMLYGLPGEEKENPNIYPYLRVMELGYGKMEQQIVVLFVDGKLFSSNEPNSELLKLSKPTSNKTFNYVEIIMEGESSAEWPINIVPAKSAEDATPSLIRWMLNI